MFFPKFLMPPIQKMCNHFFEFVFLLNVIEMDFYNIKWVQSQYNDPQKNSHYLIFHVSKW